VRDEVGDTFSLELIVCHEEALEFREIFAQTKEVEALISKEVIIERKALKALEVLDLEECFCA
jgi:hypothetical protein